MKIVSTSRKINQAVKKEILTAVPEILSLQPSLWRKIMFIDPGAITLKLEGHWLLRFPMRGVFAVVSLSEEEVAESRLFQALNEGALPVEGEPYQDKNVDRFFDWLGEKEKESQNWKLVCCPTVERWQRLETGCSV